MYVTYSSPLTSTCGNVGDPRSEIRSGQPADRSGAWRRRPSHQLVGTGSRRRSGERHKRRGYGTSPARSRASAYDGARVEQLPPAVLVAPVAVQLADVDAGRPRSRPGSRRPAPAGSPAAPGGVSRLRRCSRSRQSGPAQLAAASRASAAPVPHAVDGDDDGERAGAERDRRSTAAPTAMPATNHRRRRRCRASPAGRRREARQPPPPATAAPVRRAGTPASRRAPRPRPEPSARRRAPPPWHPVALEPVAPGARARPRPPAGGRRARGAPAGAGDGCPPGGAGRRLRSAAAGARYGLVRRRAAAGVLVRAACRSPSQSNTPVNAQRSARSQSATPVACRPGLAGAAAGDCGVSGGPVSRRRCR